MNDEFALYFGSKQLDPKPEVEKQNDANDQITMPKSEDVELIEAKRYVLSADNNLKRTKKTFSEKIDKLRKRAIIVQKEQEKLRKNLIKYNNFVKEKQFKVDEGERVFKEEKQFQENISELIRERTTQYEYLAQAQKFLEESVKQRMIFQDYLQTIIELEDEEGERNRYKDIGELMKRCETLVVTRDEAKMSLKKLQNEIAQEEESLGAFKESQNERILALSSKQNGLQDSLYRIQAKKDSKQRILDQEAQIQNEKKLQISNIKLSVLTLWQYVNSRKVILPNDHKNPPKKISPDNMDQQLEMILAHVEDLEAVIERVKKSELAEGYMSPLVSFSELRIDY